MGQFSWDSVVLSKDVKGKGSWRNLRDQSVSGRAEFPVSEGVAVR